MTIAFIGTGAMGVRMAAHLIDAGHSLRVWNRTASRAQPLVEQGATLCGTPAEAADGADAVITMVTDDDASREVWTGILNTLKSGALAIESSTLTPEWTRSLAGQISNAGGRFLDAPVAGSRPQAEAAQLIFLVGGKEADVEAARPLFDLMGGAVHHAGEAGTGMLIKLAVNGFFAVQTAAMAELLGMTDRAGIPAAKAQDILAQMPITSPALKGVSGMMVAGKFDPMFPIELVEKDLGYVVATAEASGAETPVNAAARGVYGEAIARGFGGDNITGVMKRFSA